MKKKQLYVGIISLGIASILATFNVTTFKTSFGETFLANVNIYPATFFALLGLLLIYTGLKTLWQN